MRTLTRTLAAGALCALLAALAPAARAQCGGKGAQCANCHGDGSSGPLCDRKDPWHRDHAFGGLCVDCHAGDGESSDIGPAHAGLTWPLQRDGARCDGCHPGGRGREYAARYASYRAAHPRQPRVAPPVRKVAVANVIAASLALALGAVGVTYVARNERRRREQP